MKTWNILLLFLFLAPGTHAGYGQNYSSYLDDDVTVCRTIQCLTAARGRVVLDLKGRYKNLNMIEESELPKVAWLILSKNRLRSFPPWVCSCQNLKGLEVNQNQLAELPACLSGLNELKYVSANRNPLSSIPPSFASLVNLEVMDLWQTWIDEIDPALSSLDKSLKKIDLRDIRMTRTQQEAIRALFPSTEVRMAAPCNCKPTRGK